MITNDPNTNLIEAMKEKLPLKGKLADMLMDTLYIGKEAVYRRLRGEVPFTLQEAALVSRKLGISLDKIIGISFKSNAMFDMNIVDYDDPFESYYNILYKYVRLINTLEDDPNAAFGENGGGDDESDVLYDQAVAIVLKNRRASISLVQRHLRIGYNRAARLLEQMERSGLVSPMQSNGNREILVPTSSNE